MKSPIFRVTIGQDSHRFLTNAEDKPCVIGGVIFKDASGFQANSDGDVLYHALCNALSSLTGKIILGDIADDLCQQGIVDSRVYLEHALKTLQSKEIIHISFSLECKIPKILPFIDTIKNKLAKICSIEPSQIGITATTGEGLTDFGKGLGVQSFCLLTTIEN